MRPSHGASHRASSHPGKTPLLCAIACTGLPLPKESEHAAPRVRSVCGRAWQLPSRARRRLRRIAVSQRQHAAYGVEIWMLHSLFGS